MKSQKKETIGSVYFLVPVPVGISPSQRFRFEHYLKILIDNGITYEVGSYFTMNGRYMLYSGSFLSKVLVILRGYLARFRHLAIAMKYDYVFIHREAAPVGPPIFPWLLTKVLRKKIIYDFDDAIWLPIMSDYNRKFSFVKSFSTIGKVCKWSQTVVVGNSYLKNYAIQFNNDVRIIPTVVDTDLLHNRLQNQESGEQLAIGWTGSFSTLVYLRIVLPVLQRLQEKHDFKFYVIADKDPELDLRNYEFIRWRRETEIEDLLKFHIGLMPLYDDEFSKGKCGFKAIQYMSLGIPSVVSPVGVNAEIVDNGINGFVCSSETDWEINLEHLLKDNLLRKRMGKFAREKIESKYSVKATKEDFLNLFEKNRREPRKELPCIY